MLESRESSDGQLFLYEYDEIGRLSGVVMPTGERTTVAMDVDPSGVLVDIREGERASSVSMVTNGNSVLLKSGPIFFS